MKDRQAPTHPLVTYFLFLLVVLLEWLDHRRDPVVRREAAGSDSLTIDGARLCQHGRAITNPRPRVLIGTSRRNRIRAERHATALTSSGLRLSSRGLG